jgi:hypothetical protein
VHASQQTMVPISLNNAEGPYTAISHSEKVSGMMCHLKLPLTQPRRCRNVSVGTYLTYGNTAAARNQFHEEFFGFGLSSEMDISTLSNGHRFSSIQHISTNFNV